MLGLNASGWAFRAVRMGGVALVAAVGLWSCSNPNRPTVDFSIGTEQNPLRVVVSAERLALPSALEDTSTEPSTVAEVPCDPEGDPCPSSDDVAVSCVDGTCNPEPVTVSVPLGDVFDLNAQVSGLGFGEVTGFEILDIHYAVASNTATMDVPELTVLWASEGATFGETPLAIMPAVPAGERPDGAMDVLEGGNEALSDFLVTNDPSRVRFFVEGPLDVEPGDPWPEGSLQVEAIISVRVEGRFL
jgi:hypothetical protein